MKQLTGLDAMFLYMETPTTYGHITGLMTFERPSDDYDPFTAVKAKYASLIGDIDPLRRRLVEVPFGLDHPYWINDPRFELDFHVRALNIPKPGTAEQLADQVARIVGRPMDRTRPLWEVYVIDGLPDGQWALLTKYHHSTLDGASGQMLLELMTDTEADFTPPPESAPWNAEAIPTDAELLTQTVQQLVRNPIKAARLQTRLVQSFAQSAGLNSLSGVAASTSKFLKQAVSPNADQRRNLTASLSAAPPTPWNKTISPHRRFAMRSTSLADVMTVKNAVGATVNDVVMAVCAGALRQYLIEHAALPDAPLRAMVPVSIRTGKEADPWTNRVSSIFAELPTNEADPLQRIARCSDAMKEAKRQFELVPADALVDLTQFSPPVLATAAVRLAAQQKLADRMAPPFNLVISNVPGPRHPIYFAGAEMAHQYPVSIVTDGQGLNATVLSYKEHLDFGFISDRELVPDLQHLADLHADEVQVLLKAATA